MPRINDLVADAFNELADLLEISGGDRFRILAYRRVAAEIGAQARDLTSMTEKELASLRGVGKATASKVHEFLQTGTMQKLEDARLAVPAGLLAMTRLPGLGPKTALLLHRELGVCSIEDLKQAVLAERVRTVPGLGAKTEEKLSRTLRELTVGTDRVDLETALLATEDILTKLTSCSIAARAGYAGSLRRMKETIGDVDILVASQSADEVNQAVRSWVDPGELQASGGTKTTFKISGGLQVDVRVVASDEFGSAMQYFTGSKEHNVRVREIAVKHGYKLSEYGLFRVEGGVKIAGEVEAEVYEALGMQAPPPTMRENRGEIELALAGGIPPVVQLTDIRGDLHSHSRYSDGLSTIYEMATTAADLGYEYYAITDHGGSSHVRSISADQLETQILEVAELREAFGGKISILHGMELDIGPAGDLVYPPELLEQLDLIIMSVHDSFGLDRGAMTSRLMRALEHPWVNIFGHPTARRIGKRPAIDFDMEAVFSMAKERGVALEINSTPQRLDLKDDHIRLAREIGCMFSIDTDAHGPSRLHRMRFGVGMAQRGWLTPPQIINTWPLADLMSFLNKQ